MCFPFFTRLVKDVQFQIMFLECAHIFLLFFRVPLGNYEIGVSRRIHEVDSLGKGAQGHGNHCSM
jgi:hypothetical protein